VITFVQFDRLKARER